MAYTTINKSSDYFNTKLYTGNGNAGNGITGVGFQPDFTWIKNREGAYWHQTYDAVRGASAGALYTNETAAQDYMSGNGLASFNSDGFTVNANDGCNGNGQDLVAWNWKANGQGSSNTDGSINTTYTSANTTAGFSIVKYTGTGANATVGHGLGAVPKIVFYKNLVNASENWFVYSSKVGATKHLRLNSNVAETTSAGYFNNTDPTSSLLNVGTASGTNGSGNSMIAYCFAEKTGFSKFGKYIGTGSTTGTPFIYTGFKPAFVMTKGADVADQWTMSDIPRDNAVGNGNGTGARLTADSSAAESTNTSWASIQKYSNGFSPQGNDGVTNGSGSTYIFMAFAEAPLVGSNNVPCTAR